MGVLGEQDPFFALWTLPVPRHRATRLTTGQTPAVAAGEVDSPATR